MKNITFSAQEATIEKAPQGALQQHHFNEMFRDWLEDVTNNVQDETRVSRLEDLWKHTNYLHVGKKLSREKMNER